MKQMFRALLLSIVLCAACSDGVDTGAADGGASADVPASQDTFPVDRDGGFDAGGIDAGEADAGAVDGGAPLDAGTDAGADASIADTGGDAGSDAGPPDAGGDAGGDTGDTGDAGDLGDGGLFVRIIAGNITSGSAQSYDPGDGINIFKSLKPDIALVQEINYKDNSPEDYKEFSQAILGTDYYAVDSAGFQIPNGVLSKWPITASGYWDDPNISNRELLWATIDIPGPVDIMAISVHLHTSPSADQIAASLVIVDEVKAHKAANPGMYYYVVGGDFNGTASVSNNGFGKGGVFYVSGPHPADDDGNENTNSNRSSQYDYVLGDNAMHGFQIPVAYPSNKNASAKTYDDGLVFDTRTYSQSVLDEYFPPASTSDSGASNMQHMAIVKDYLVR